MAERLQLSRGLSTTVFCQKIGQTSDFIHKKAHAAYDRPFSNTDRQSSQLPFPCRNAMLSSCRSNAACKTILNLRGTQGACLIWHDVIGQVAG